MSDSTERERIRIQSLPEKNSILKGDYIIVDDNTDTYKTKMELFTDYLDGCIDEAKSDVDKSLGQMETLKSQLVKSEEARTRQFEEWNTAEKNRDTNFQKYEDAFNESKSTLDDCVAQYNQVQQSENKRKEDFEQMQNYVQGLENSEQIRVKNETARQAAAKKYEDTFKTYETKMSDIESAESNRIESENERISAENERKKTLSSLQSIIENTQQSENKRNEDFENIKNSMQSSMETISEFEQKVIKFEQSEDQRVKAEQDRKDYFDSVVIAEQNRATAEQTRNNNESTRNQNETLRIANENKRIEYFAEIKEFIDNFKQEAFPIFAYPVGAVYESVLPDNPAEALGGGTWELLNALKLEFNNENGGTIYAEPKTIYTWVRTE